MICDNILGVRVKNSSATWDEEEAELFVQGDVHKCLKCALA